MGVIHVVLYSVFCVLLVESTKIIILTFIPSKLQGATDADCQNNETVSSYPSSTFQACNSNLLYVIIS